jgi:hypothetical protein
MTAIRWNKGFGGLATVVDGLRGDHPASRIE